MNAERTHCIAGPLSQHPEMSPPRRPHLGPPLRLLWMGIGGGIRRVSPLQIACRRRRHFLEGLSPPLKSTRERGREMPLAFPKTDGFTRKSYWRGKMGGTGSGCTAVPLSISPSSLDRIYSFFLPGVVAAAAAVVASSIAGVPSLRVRGDGGETNAGTNLVE